MKTTKTLPWALFFGAMATTALVTLSTQTALADNHDESQPSLESLSMGNHRSAENIARNQHRHPVETLRFFGLEPDMTVIEILPSGGWYTEIIAPYLINEGTFYAAHFSPNAQLSYMPATLAAFEQKLVSDPDNYGKTIVRHLNPPHEVAIAPPASADMAMTFRNVHNWIMAGQEQEFFASFFTALKPGGVLGVVEHRAKPDSGMEVMRTSGYVTEDYVIELATAAGFELVEKSEINANPKDPAAHPEGVWTLPPSYQLGDVDRARYAEIGESDRMTLKFVKPK